MGASCTRVGSDNGALLRPGGARGAEAVYAGRRGRPDLADSRARHDYAEATIKQRATASLLAGTLFGLMAIGYLIYLATCLRDDDAGLNMYGQPFPSGNDYVFSGMSELINHAKGTQGTVFYGFILVSGFLLIISWYPFELSNVYVGDEGGCMPCCSFLPTFQTARSLLPPLGMLLVASAHVQSRNVASASQIEALLPQLGGFALMVGGFVYFELYTLTCARDVEFGAGERCVRLLLVLLVAASGLCFFGAPLVLHATEPCCGDVFMPVNMTVVHQAQSNTAYIIAARDLELMQHSAAHPDAPYPLYRGLYDTATGLGRQLKLLRFWGEVCAMLFVVLSHLAIWYFCPERSIQVPKYSAQADGEDGAAPRVQQSPSRTILA